MTVLAAHDTQRCYNQVLTYPRSCHIVGNGWEKERRMYSQVSGLTTAPSHPADPPTHQPSTQQHQLFRHSLGPPVIG